MSIHPRWFILGLGLVILLAILTASPGQAQTGTCCDASWKLPLPAGQWLITQGDKDACVSTHCSGDVINTYALDLIAAPNQGITTMGTSILAPADGTVLDELWDGYGGGNVLKLEHGSGGPVSYYLHLSGYQVDKGAKVKQKDPIANLGSSGNSTGPHLHFVVFKSKTERIGLKITSFDGNTDFRTGSKITSTNGSGTSPTEPAGVPSLSQPGNGSSWGSNKEISLAWNASDHASQYKVELWGGPYGTMTPCDWQAGTSCRIGTMYAGSYHWHVKARNSSGQASDWSPTWDFTIEGPTPTPAPATPTPTRSPATATPTQAVQSLDAPRLRDPSNNNSYPQSKDVWFGWDYSSGATDYYLEYWGGPYGTLNSGWISDSAYHIGTMWPGTYRWRVKARSSKGTESGWSDTWRFTIEEPAAPAATATPTTAAPAPATAAPTETRVPQPGSVQLVDDLTLRTESGTWPPQSGQKIIAHIKIRNGGDQTIHIEHIGVRGRRNGSDSWDIGFWSVDLNGHDVWLLDPNNERPLVPGNYSFRISYSLDGSHWMEIGNEINFTVP